MKPSLCAILRPAHTTLFLFLSLTLGAAPLPEEKPLWPDPNWQNPIYYDVPEAISNHSPRKASLSGLNRVYSFVSMSSYSIHEPANGSATGLGLVICPGGGFRELWLDREGHDLAVWLKTRGITSLVLKYRTNAEIKPGERKFPPDVYVPAVTEDARQAIRILRAHLAQADPGNRHNHVGICGFSAGGALAVYSVFRQPSNPAKDDISGSPDFAGLFYPGLREADAQLVASAKHIPPLFIINAVDDRLTPVDRCVDFYQLLLKAGAPAELHLFNKGGHGFDMGEGHGDAVGLWKESFMAWLRDTGFLTPPLGKPDVAGASSASSGP
jgi:acetyl esterase/lipase